MSINIYIYIVMIQSFATVVFTAVFIGCPAREFKDFYDKIEWVNSEAELKAIRDESKPFKLALTDLVSSTRNASNQLTKQVNTGTGKPKGKGKGGKGANPAAGVAAADGTKPSNLLFDFVFDKGTAMNTLDFSQLPDPMDALDAPYAITNIPTAQEILTAISKFEEKFQASNLRDKAEGRAEQSLKSLRDVGAPAADAATEVFGKIVKMDAILDPAGFSKIKEMESAAYGIRNGVEICSCERGRSAVARFQTQGTREILIASTCELKDFIRDCRSPPSWSISESSLFFSSKFYNPQPQLAFKSQAHPQPAQAPPSLSNTTSKMISWPQAAFPSTFPGHS